VKIIYNVYIEFMSAYGILPQTLKHWDRLFFIFYMLMSRLLMMSLNDEVLRRPTQRCIDRYTRRRRAFGRRRLLCPAGWIMLLPTIYPEVRFQVAPKLTPNKLVNIKS